MQLHAAVSVDGRDRKRLERVCRYLLRPPFALAAVQRTADGQVRVRCKKPSRNGAAYAQMSPERFLARLCALVPPPGAHTVRYYGVLAPRHALRTRIIPTPEVTNTEPKQLSLFVPQGQLELAVTTGPALDKLLLGVAPHRLSWMSLLARVFASTSRFASGARARCGCSVRWSSPDEIAEALHAAQPPPRPLPRGQLMLFSGPITPSLTASASDHEGWRVEGGAAGGEEGEERRDLDDVSNGLGLHGLFACSER